jgi:hypothetical protein
VVAIWTLCAWIAWTPAWDFTASTPADVHYFYEDGLPPIVAFTPEMEVCRVDYDAPHAYAVSGFNAEGEGPLSDYLVVIWPSEVPEPGGVLPLALGGLLIAGLRRKTTP